jgi:hypothetical protein
MLHIEVPKGADGIVEVGFTWFQWMDRQIQGNIVTWFINQDIFEESGSFFRNWVWFMVQVGVRILSHRDQGLGWMNFPFNQF